MWASLCVAYGMFTLIVAVALGACAVEVRNYGDYSDEARWFAWGALLSPLWPIGLAAAILSLPFVLLYGLTQMVSIVLGRKRD